jgi:uncharacterized protein YkwD
MRLIRFSSLICSCLLFTLLVTPVNAFIDVADNSEYRTAIEFLKNRSVVSGYPDGTFKATNTINRAELTKILLTSNKIAIQKANAKCFKDVPLNEWYTDFVCTAKNLGWVQGYPDGTFRPASNINRAEALKIISVAEGWAISDPILSPFKDVPLNQWYTNHVYYAKNKNYLPFVGAFSPTSNINRGEFSEVYYRILYTEENKLSEFDLGVDNLVPNIEYYSKNTFSSLMLDSDFPKKFLRNESFTFSGTVKDKTVKLLTFAVFDSNNVQIDTVPVKVTDGRFEFGYKFNTLGFYSISLTNSVSLNAQLAKIQVLDLQTDLLLSTEFDAKEFEQSLSFDGTFTKLDLVNSADLVKIDFIQDSNRVSSYFRLENESMYLSYPNFKNFEEGKLEVLISAANFIDSVKATNFKEVSRKNYNVVNHYKSEVTDGVTLNALPIFHSGKLNLSGMANTTLDSTIYLINPDGLVSEYEYESKIVRTGSKFNYSLSLQQNGTYIVELNNDNGLAVVNHPVYKSGSYPLIPDYFDLNPPRLDKFTGIDEDLEVEMLLDLINDDRRSYGLKKVSLDDDLSLLAESHNVDMIDNNYFSHTNLRGESPQDRAINFGIDTIVGENIAKVVGTEFGHEALMRSAIHRQNILDPAWTMVGLSVKKNLQGYYYIGQQFSLSRSDFSKNIKAGVSTAIPSLTVNQALNTRADDWVSKMITESEFSTNIGTENIFDTLSSSVGVTSVQALILTGTNASTMVGLLLDNSDVLTGSWTDYGLAIDFKSDGEAVVVFIWGK